MKKFRYSLRKMFFLIVFLNFIFYLVIKILTDTSNIHEIVITDKTKKLVDEDLKIASKFCFASSLSLYNSNVTGLGFKYFRHFQNLEKLSLTLNEITDEGLRIISTLPHLQSLSLSNEKNITEKGYAFIQNMKPLHELHLEGLNITDQDLFYISRLTNISVLFLSGTNITNAGIIYLKDLKNLNTLLLKGNNKVDNEGLSYLSSFGFENYIPPRYLRLAHSIYFNSKKMTDSNSQIFFGKAIKQVVVKTCGTSYSTNEHYLRIIIDNIRGSNIKMRLFLGGLSYHNHRFNIW